MATEFLLAQLSDLHVVEAGARLGGRVDTNGAAEAAVNHLNELDPRPDLVIVTGDLTDNGRAEQYAEARRILEQLEIRYVVIPGNHDRRAGLLAEFADRCGCLPGGRVAYVLDEYPLRLIGLDSLIEDADEGMLGADQLSWLDRTLSEDDARPTVVFVHHPPLDTGVWWMDTARLADAADFASVLSRHHNVIQVLAGHVHRTVSGAWAGVPLSIGPSTAFEVLLDLEPEAPPRAVVGAPAFHLHRFDGAHMLTHRAQLGHPPEVIDLAPFFGDWPTTRASWRNRAAGLR